jgi:hypothetical protein
MVLAVATAVDSKVLAPTGNRITVRGIQGKIEQIDDAA